MNKKRGLLSWVLEFAGRKKSYYFGSVILAILGVATSFIPYLLIADIVKNLLDNNKDSDYYLKMVILMAICWIVRVTLHSISTTLSHIATFNVLGGIREQLCEKLSKIPLGSVLDDNSGAYKNIIVERVDSMETTLAHIIPEFTAYILLPLVMFIYIIKLDYRMGLANLISAVIGVAFAAVMMMKSQGEFDKTVKKTKYLNDTAVEYINGIEVIKAFGKTGSSYEKFVNAAREGADCFIDWMRKCIWWQCGSLSFMPATFLGVLPVGLYLVNKGSLTPEKFITCINIRFGKPEASMDEVIAAAKKACCHDFIMNLPDGYETILGEGGATISGGEKQRIAIARAIMKDAPIIILDEATANVDPENEKELTQAIENLTKEKTIIMIAHRLKTVRNADQIIVIDKGKIVQKGKHDELIKEDGIYKTFVLGRKKAVSWKLA